MVVLATKGQPIYNHFFTKILGFWDRDFKFENPNNPHYYKYEITRPIDLFPPEGIQPEPVYMEYRSGMWSGSSNLTEKDLENVEGVLLGFDNYQKQLSLAFRILSNDRGALNLLITSGVLSKLETYIKNRESNYQKKASDYQIEYLRAKEGYPSFVLKYV